MEAAFDKYYERVNYVNSFINAVGLKETEKDEGRQLDHLQNMRVFAQLDNLEYVLGKLDVSSTAPDLVERSVRAFRSDCALPWFREKTLYWIGPSEGQEVAKGYRCDTRVVARTIVAQCARPASMVQGSGVWAH